MKLLIHPPAIFVIYLSYNKKQRIKSNGNTNWREYIITINDKFIFIIRIFYHQIFRIRDFSFPSISRKSDLRGKSKLVISLAQGMRYLWARVEGWTLPSLSLFAPTCLSRTLAYTTSRPHFSRLYTREPAYTCCSTRPPPSFHLRWVKSMEDDQWLSTLVVCLNLTGDRIIVVEASSPLLRSSS